ncbi:putative serine/threonine protein kinase afsK [Fimbriiglobus ruber]|uniref:Putative serine/threonine protein kinase afsK n=1 Tax=Fimbriiglobus ruber TaxID=1908690 RepID=A0A225DF89_9BACT|nr:putative serine/threonine protein kinase afsK [Fimbriiglobus ruber]
MFTFALAPAARADWPEFRGPTAQGHASGTGLPTEWAEDKNVAWKVPIPGKGWSSPVVVAGKIFLTTAVPQGPEKNADQSLRTLCLDSKTGAVVWDKEVFSQDGKTAPGIHAKNSHASPTPFIDGDHVYVHFGHQGTACLIAKTGEVVWTNRELKYAPVHGNGGSPVVWNGKLYFCIDGPGRRELVALDKVTGKVVWVAKRSQPAKKAFSFGTPLVVTFDKTTMIVAPGSDVVNGFDAETGAEIWAITYDGYSLVPRPVFGHGMLFMSTGFDTAWLLAIKLVPDGGKVTATVAWRTKQDAPHDPSPLLVSDELYTVSDSGIVTCFDAKSGKVHFRERVPGAYTSAPVFANGHIYLQNETGTASVIKAGKTFELVATNKLDGRVQASYAADGNAWLIRTDKFLYKIAAK